MSKFQISDVEALKRIKKVFKEAKQKGFEIPSFVSKIDSNLGALGSWQTFPGKNGTLLVETDIEKIQKQKGDNFENILWHELGHLYHMKKNPYIPAYRQFIPDVTNKIKSGVSNYAATNCREFVAEIFCGLYGPRHRVFDAQLMKIYVSLLNKNLVNMTPTGIENLRKIGVSI